ncbi:MAG: cytochrome c [Rhodocyclales bacterium]|nr:cytochrome c [Rhodocyclales bacterium]
MTGRSVRFVVVAASVLLSACAADKPESGVDPRDANQVARGTTLYGAHCASCHGARLEGQPDWRRRLPNGRLPAPPHDDSGHTWHHPDADLLAMIRNGIVPPLAPEGYKSDMPAFAGTLSDDDMRAALAYIQSHWSPEILAVRERMLEQRKR